MNPFPCYHCGCNQLSEGKNRIHENKGIEDEVTITFSSCEEYLSHIIKDHPEVSEKHLIGMTRRKPKNEVQGQIKVSSYNCFIESYWSCEKAKEIYYSQVMEYFYFNFIRMIPPRASKEEMLYPYS